MLSFRAHESLTAHSLLELHAVRSGIYRVGYVVNKEGSIYFLTIWLTRRTCLQPQCAKGPLTADTVEF